MDFKLKINHFLGILGFFLLPISPEISIALIALIGLLKIQNNFKLSFLWFLIFPLLGTVSQIFAPSQIFTPFLNKNLEISSKNLLSYNTLQMFQGWGKNAYGGVSGIYSGNGFWKMPRYDPQTKAEYLEIATFEVVSVHPSTSYVISFYFYSDNSDTKFLVNFISNSKYNFVKPKIENINNNLKRAWAAYTTRSDELKIRGLDIVGFSGNWKYINIGFVQLEKSKTPTEYKYNTNYSSLRNVLWFFGISFLQYFSLTGFFTLFKTYKNNFLHTSLVTGVLFIAIFSSLQFFLNNFHRVSGFQSHPNLLGLTGLISSIILFFLNFSFLTGLFTLICGGVIFYSGSRISFFLWFSAYFLPLISLISKKNIYTRLTLIVVFMCLLLGFSILNFNRLDSILNSDDFSLQSRLQIAKISLTLFEKYSIFGFGITQFPIYFYVNSPIGTLEPFVSHTHNLSLYLLTSTGILGFLGFSSFWIYIYLIIFQNRLWSEGVFLALTFIINIFDFTFFNASITFLSMFIVARIFLHSFSKK